MPDSVLLTDGRVLRGTVLVEEEGRYLVLPHGKLALPEDQVKDIFIDPGEDYEPRNERERRFLEEGYVFFERVWMRRERRDQLLEERREDLERRLQEIQSHYAFANAWETTTPHFVVRSNTSPERLEETARLMESFYEHFRSHFRVADSALSGTTRPEVRLYRDLRQYQDSGAPAGTVGFFDPVAQVLSVAHDPSDLAYSREVLFHEGTHLLLGLLRPGFYFPIWMNEGLAEYYATAVPTPDGWELGGILEGRLVVLRRALEDGRLPGLKEVLLTEKSRFAGLHYAISWSFVHFLLQHDRFRGRFQSFFRQIATGRDVSFTTVEMGGVSFRSVALDETLALLLRRLQVRDSGELQESWRSYVEGLPAPGPRGWLAAARLHLEDRELRAAEHAARQALYMGASKAEAHRLLGRLHALLYEWESCAEHYGLALDADPLASATHFEFGQAMTGGREVPGELREEGRRHLWLASELDPFEPRYAAAVEKLRR